MHLVEGEAEGKSNVPQLLGKTLRPRTRVAPQERPPDGLCFASRDLLLLTVVSRM